MKWKCQITVFVAVHYHGIHHLQKIELMVNAFMVFAKTIHGKPEEEKSVEWIGKKIKMIIL